MNLASWIILAVVIAILALAVKATFFPKKRHGGCCDAGDPMKLTEGADCPGCPSARGLSSCQGCSACEGGATARNALKPVIK